MRLIRDHSDGAYAVDVSCLTCGAMHRLAESVIDTHGPAFRAYYCPKHIPSYTRIARCTRDGCAREECRVPRRVEGFRDGEDGTATEREVRRDWEK